MSLSNSDVAQWPKRFEDFADQKMLSDLNMGTRKRRGDGRRDTQQALKQIFQPPMAGQTPQKGAAGGAAVGAARGATDEGTSTPPLTSTSGVASAGASATPTATHTARSHTGNTARAARGPGGHGDSGPYGVRSLHDVAASLPPHAFRATVPALYPRPRSPGGGAAGGAAGADDNTVGNDGVTVATVSESRADADRAAGDRAGAVSAPATAGKAADRARAALEARGQADAPPRAKSTGADGMFGCVRKTVLRGPPYGKWGGGGVF